jgi:hypothetical protein
MPGFNEGVECIINKTICAMREVFDPNSSNPPLGGGTNTVRVFAGAATPLAAVDIHVNDCGCDGDPFLWVRLVNRYRSKTFPQPYVGADNCATQIAVGVEVGVARCAVISTEGADWKALAEEAEISLDDSGRIELALCRAASLMRSSSCSDMQAIDAVVPYGPDGGVIAWTGTLYAAVST